MISLCWYNYHNANFVTLKKSEHHKVWLDKNIYWLDSNVDNLVSNVYNMDSNID